MEGNIKEYKARLVARGFNQQPGIDYNETFSPVVRLNTLRIILALAVEEDLELHQYDFTTAYLNGILKEETYMEIPEGITGYEENEVCKLKKGIYGLKQSAATWYETLKKQILKLNFEELFSESCVFVHRESKNEYIILCIYVDDILAISTSKILNDKVMNKLKEKFDIK